MQESLKFDWFVLDKISDILELQDIFILNHRRDSWKNIKVNYTSNNPHIIAASFV